MAGPSASDISARLRASRADWLPRVFPAGRIERGMFMLGNADGDAGRSFPIPLDGRKAESLTDFGGERIGDDLDLYCRGTRQSMSEAVKELATRFGLSNGASHNSTRHNGTKPTAGAAPEHAKAPGSSLEPFPDGGTIPNHPQLGKPDGVWFYRRPDGRPTLAHLRFDERDASGALALDDHGKVRKQFRPLIWRDGQFRWEWVSTRPLYGLTELTTRPDVPVLVVEGERTADAARLMLPSMAVVTWPQGTSGATKADWSTLQGRQVVIWPDADEPGAKAGVIVADLLRKTGAASIRLVALPPRIPNGWDLADTLPPGWDVSTVKRMIREAPEAKAETPTADEGPLGDEPPPPAADPDAPRRSTGAATIDSLDDLVNPADLTGEPPDREWIVVEWLSRKTVTLLAGSGGTGKSLLAQQLMASTALGRSFLGLDTTPCKSLAFFCEDDDDELHRRGKSICFHYGVWLRDIDGVRWQGRFGKPNVLATFDDGLLQATEFFDFIVAAMEHTGADLLILDNVAQLFGGNENDRSEVTQFVNKIGELAVRFNCAVLLLAHPGKSETGLTSEYSGSTGWDAAVRSRWILERPKPDADQEARELTDLRVLRKAKANYSTIGDEIALKWDHGAFAVTGTQTIKDAVDKIEERAQERSDDNRFLDCLDVLAAQNRAVSDSKNTATFAGKVMMSMPQWKGEAKAKARIFAAMNRLFAAGTIMARVEVGRKSSRHPLLGIGRATGAPQSNETPETVRRGAPQCAAPECATATANPLETLRQSVTPSVSPTPPTRAVAPMGAPPSPEDFSALAEEAWS